MTRRKPICKNDAFLDFNIKDLLNHIFVLHLNAEAFLYEIKKNLETADISELFNYLDLDKNGFLTLNEVNTLCFIITSLKNCLTCIIYLQSIMILF